MKISAFFTLLALTCFAVSSVEAQTPSANDVLLDADFATIDTNKDGFIDASELLAFQQTGIDDPQDVTFQTIDANQDGVITKEEFLDLFGRQDNSPQALKELEQRFKTADTDSSGDLSAQEIKQFRQKNISADNQELFQAIDTNRDGKISRQEFTEFFSFVKEMFKMVN